MPKEQNGFTLVELAIALMVIGLLIGGVLKGQELIKNAKVIQTVKYLHDIDTAVMIFRSTYNGLPGDLKNPNRIPGCTSVGYCSLIRASTGDSIIDNNSIDQKNFWVHLGKAGLINGVDYNADFYACVAPENSFGGKETSAHTEKWRADQNRLIPGHSLAIADNLAGENPSSGNDVGCKIYYAHPQTAKMIDTKMDDGKPYQGLLRVEYRSNNADYTCHDTANEEEYASVKPGIGCWFHMSLTSAN